MNFRDFKNELVQAANSHFTRVGRKMFWTYETGELIFLVKFEKDTERPTYEINIFYGHHEWVTRDPMQLLCGAGVGIRRLVEKGDLDLQIDYHGTHENFYGIFFNSYTGDSRDEIRTLANHPELANLEKRRADFETFFATLKNRFDQSATLQAMARMVGVTIPDFWSMVEQRMADCQK